MTMPEKPDHICNPDHNGECLECDEVEIREKSVEKDCCPIHGLELVWVYLHNGGMMVCGECIETSFKTEREKREKAQKELNDISQAFKNSENFLEKENEKLTAQLKEAQDEIERVKNHLEPTKEEWQYLVTTKTSKLEAQLKAKDELICVLVEALGNINAEATLDNQPTMTADLVKRMARKTLALYEAERKNQ